MKQMMMMVLACSTVSVLAADGSVQFVECPKCDKRMRISEDGREAFVNLSRIDPERKAEMAARAKRLLALGAPVSPANPKTPLMGWSSWNTFGVDISEEIILGIARAMATNGLKEAGYVYVNIDDGFFWGHGPDGRLRFHPERFPNGMKGTVDGIHALGLKAGTYSDAGSDTCGSMWGGSGSGGKDKGGVGAGLYGHDAADCALHFNELGFDFIKVDYCGGTKLKLDERARYTEISKAIKATGRSDVRFNICRWAFPGTWVADVAGSWRTTGDIRANWKSVRGIIAENLYLSAYASPGHFNDLDMLEVGQIMGAVKSVFGKHGDTGLTLDEEATHFGIWCIMSSPLLLGCDVRTMPPATMKLVTNPYLIRMNQDPLGLQAYVAVRDGDAYVLVKDADERFGLSRYVALYNAGDSEYEFTVTAKSLDLGGKIAAFDLMERADVGEFEDNVAVKVRPHAAKFYRFDAEKRLDRNIYEAETAYLTDYSEIGEGSAAPKGSERKRARWAETAGASGGVAVTDLGGRASNDLVWKDVHVSKGGKYRLVFRCASPERRSFSMQVDGGAATPLVSEASAGRFADVSTEVVLSAGTHSVRLSNADAPMPDVDVMYLARKE
ncbi:MAG: alpha-galactosidase [Kiritimatiellae bacterium]|nr:alpha-galactosidase [Kiritimatiellia bacterium]